MRYTAKGVPYDICPVCHEMILPKMFGGKDHINGHAISEANRYFRTGDTIRQVNARLSGLGITLYPNIPIQMQNVTRNTIITYDNEDFQMIEFTHYEAIRLRSLQTGYVKTLKLWDRRFLSLAKLNKP